MLDAVRLLMMGASLGVAEKAPTLAVSSPNGEITIALSLTGGVGWLPGTPRYRVSFRGKAVIADSPLGLDFVGAAALDRDLEVIGVDRQSNATTWENPLGPRRIVPDRYRQLTVSLRERGASGRRVDLILRAYDEGAAFR